MTKVQLANLFWLVVPVFGRAWTRGVSRNVFDIDGKILGGGFGIFFSHTMKVFKLFSDIPKFSSSSHVFLIVHEMSYLSYDIPHIFIVSMPKVYLLKY